MRKLVFDFVVTVAVLAMLWEWAPYLTTKFFWNVGGYARVTAEVVVKGWMGIEIPEGQP